MSHLHRIRPNAGTNPSLSCIASLIRRFCDSVSATRCSSLHSELVSLLAFLGAYLPHATTSPGVAQHRCSAVLINGDDDPCFPAALTTRACRSVSAPLSRDIPPYGTGRDTGFLSSAIAQHSLCGFSKGAPECRLCALNCARAHKAFLKKDRIESLSPSRPA